MDKESLEALKGEVGKIGSKLEERAAASEAKAKEIEAKVSKLEGAGEDFKRRYFEALASGRAITARHDESADEFLARALEEHSQERVVRSVSRGEIPRGLAGVKDTGGLMAMRLFRAMAVSFLRNGGHIDLDTAAKVCLEWGDKRAAGELEKQRDLVKDANGSDFAKREHAQRALGTSIVGAGAGFVPAAVYAGFLDFLHPKTAIRKLGAKTLPMKGGKLEIPYLDTAATAAYRGQHAAAQTSDPGEKLLTLIEKLLAGQIVMSNELLADASMAIEVFLRDHLARVMASAFDLKALRGLGASSEIRGLDWWLDSTKNPMVSSSHKYNRTLQGGVATAKTIRADLLGALQVIEEENVDLSQGMPGIVMTVREKYGLMRVVDTQDRSIFLDEMRGGTILGLPFASTTQLPKTLTGDAAGSGTGNKARVYVADFSTLVIGENEAPQVEFQRGAAYKDASGVVQSGFSNNESALAIFERHDFGCLYRGKEGVIIDSVDWGVAF
jgi:HK97 family phage major capsid protein